MSEDLFIGWSAQAPARDRRFLLGAAVGLVGAAALGGYALGARGADPGPGAWDQSDVRDHVGLLVNEPYPALIMASDAGLKTAFLASYGKVRVPERDLAPFLGAVVSVRGSIITRGERTMIAALDGKDWIRPAASSRAFTPESPRDLGPAALVGEILDAKCWFGAMRPAIGKTHKACAALCAKGGLPLAFCPVDVCAEAKDAPLLLDADGRAHGPALSSLVADRVFAVGRMVQMGDVVQFRVAPDQFRRL